MGMHIIVEEIDPTLWNVEFSNSTKLAGSCGNLLLEQEPPKDNLEFLKLIWKRINASKEYYRNIVASFTIVKMYEQCICIRQEYYLYNQIEEIFAMSQEFNPDLIQEQYPPINICGMSYDNAIKCIAALKEIGVVAGITVGGVWSDLWKFMDNYVPEKNAVYWKACEIIKEHGGYINVGETPLQRHFGETFAKMLKEKEKSSE